MKGRVIIPSAIRSKMKTVIKGGEVKLLWARRIRVAPMTRHNSGNCPVVKENTPKFSEVVKGFHKEKESKRQEALRTLFGGNQ